MGAFQTRAGHQRLSAYEAAACSTSLLGISNPSGPPAPFSPRRREAGRNNNGNFNPERAASAFQPRHHALLEPVPAYFKPARAASAFQPMSQKSNPFSSSMYFNDRMTHILSRLEAEVEPVLLLDVFQPRPGRQRLSASHSMLCVHRNLEISTPPGPPAPFSLLCLQSSIRSQKKQYFLRASFLGGIWLEKNRSFSVLFFVTWLLEYPERLRSESQHCASRKFAQLERQTTILRLKVASIYANRVCPIPMAVLYPTPQ